MRSDHLIISEKDLFSFLALFAALFSIKVFSGFFFSCFLLSLPLLMIATPYFSEQIYPPLGQPRPAPSLLISLSLKRPIGNRYPRLITLSPQAAWRTNRQLYYRLY